jgi:DNA-binding response OmpR family regulator
MPIKKILIADDEENLRLLVRTTLEDPDYRIIEAADGTEALRLIREEKPDIILLDWMMPGMTGIEVLQAVKAEAALAATPVVMLTAKAQAADRERGLQLGASEYLFKPFSPLELLTVVERILQSSS